MIKNSTKMFQDCDFPRRLKLCSINNISEEINTKEKYEYDHVYSYNYAKFIYTLILIPIICTLSIILNLITFKITFIYVEIPEKIHEIKHKMFEDLKAITILNISYCTMSLLAILSESLRC